MGEFSTVYWVGGKNVYQDPDGTHTTGMEPSVVRIRKDMILGVFTITSEGHSSI